MGRAHCLSWEGSTTALEAITAGLPCAYHLDIASAARSATRSKRVEKHAPRILDGKGLRDR